MKLAIHNQQILVDTTNMLTAGNFLPRVEEKQELTELTFKSTVRSGFVSASHRQGVLKCKLD